MTAQVRETRRHTLAHMWLVAAVWALIFGSGRLLADALVPPHLTWWFSAAVAMGTSLATSWYWISWHRNGAR